MLLVLFVLSATLLFYLWWKAVQRISSETTAFMVRRIFNVIGAYYKVVGLILLLLVAFTLLSAGFLLWAETSHFDSLCSDQKTVLLRNSEKLVTTFGGSLYLTWVSLMTIGFGDLAPISSNGRTLCVINSLVGIFLLGGLIVAIFATSVDAIKPFRHLSEEDYRKILKDAIAEAEREQIEKQKVSEGS